MGRISVILVLHLMVHHVMGKDIPSTSSLPIPGEDPVSGATTRLMSRVQKDPTFDPCSPNLCTNGGECVATPDKKFYCVCPEGFVGRLCQRQDFSIPDPCAPNPCYNGGQCSKKGTSFSCFCANGFGGSLCDKTVNDDPVDSQPSKGITAEQLGPCVNHPCKYGGICNVIVTPGTGYQDFSCTCEDGYFGKSCQFSVTDENAQNPCFPNPCGPGVCEVLKGDKSGYRCNCGDAYLGGHCETLKESDAEKSAKHRIINENMRRRMYASSALDPHSEDFDPCAASPCHNGGKCNLSDDLDLSCDCRLGYAGHFCERDISKFNGCVSDPCYNGGQCITEVHELRGYRCDCGTAFEGALCERRAGDHSHHQVHEVPHLRRPDPETPFARRRRVIEEKHAESRMRVQAEAMRAAAERHGRRKQ